MLEDLPPVRGGRIALPPVVSFVQEEYCLVFQPPPPTNDFCIRPLPLYLYLSQNFGVLQSYIATTTRQIELSNW